MTRLIVTAAAALTLVSACSADATPPARSAIPPAPKRSLHGKIAYSTRGGDIWVMNATGSGRRRITRSGRGIDFDPDFSPDGRHIVFRTSRGHYEPDTHGIGLEGIGGLAVYVALTSRLELWEVMRAEAAKNREYANPPPLPILTGSGRCRERQGGRTFAV